VEAVSVCAREGDRVGDPRVNEELRAFRQAVGQDILSDQHRVGPGREHGTDVV
jgi:hypothetical protein